MSMSKLGIKIIFSYVAMAAISTIVFTVVIRTIMLDSVIFGEEVDGLFVGLVKIISMQTDKTVK